MNIPATIAPLISEADEAIRVADRQTLTKVIGRSERILATLPVSDRPLLQALIIHWQGFGFYFTSRYDRALPLFEQARALFQDLQIPQFVARAIKNAGACYQFGGEIRIALDHMEQARSIYHDLNDRIGEATSLSNIANLLLLEGEYDQALQAYELALSMHQEENDLDGIARTTGNIANLLKETGRPADALKQYHEALHAYQDLKDASGIARISGNIGGALYSMGDFAEALEWYYRALSIHEDLGDRIRIARMKSNIASVYSETGEPTTALSLYQEALRLHEEINDKVGIAHITGTIGQVSIDLERYDEAVTLLERAIALARASGVRRIEAYNVSALSWLYLQLGRVDDARALLVDTDDLVADIPAIRAEILGSKAVIAHHGGDADSARDLFLQALEIARHHQLRQPEISVLRGLRNLYRTAGPLSLYVQYDDEYESVLALSRGEQQQRRLAVATAERRISEERRRAERQRMLLYNALPSHIAERLLDEETDVAEVHEHAAVLFLDIVDFTKHAQTIDPLHLIQFLNKVFTACDVICAEHGMMKIKTIGDAYMAVAFEDAAATAAKVAIEMQQLAFHWPASSDSLVEFRIGLHIGPVIAGVIGTERLQYDVWGDTVNVASRLEGTSLPGKIHVSEDYARAMGNGELGMNAAAHSPFPIPYSLVPRGEIQLKGKGAMLTYWLQ